LKENWLIVLAIVLVLFFTFGSNLFSSIPRFTSFADVEVFEQGVPVMEAASFRGGFSPPISQDFAPDILERKIVKTTSISTEVNRGTFKEAESKVLNIIESSESILLNQNVNKIGKDKKSYFVGNYNLKVDTAKYDSVVAQLKDIGEVTNFNENEQDVTGRFENIKVEIQTEKSRLKRFEQLFDETKEAEQKIQLTDRIFNQERRIKYLVDSLRNIGKRVEYSTISLRLNEKSSDYIDIAFVKFSQLIKRFVESINSLLKIIFYLIPWAITLYIIRFLFKLVKRRKN